MDTEDAATSTAPKVYLPGMEGGLNEGDELVFDPSAYLMYVREGGREGGWEGGVGGMVISLNCFLSLSGETSRLGFIDPA